MCFGGVRNTAVVGKTFVTGTQCCSLQELREPTGLDGTRGECNVAVYGNRRESTETGGKPT